MKDQIYFTKRSGKFISKFENKHPGIICPGFYILHWALGCLGNCSYCWLRGTTIRPFARYKKYCRLAEKPKMVVYTNTDRMFKEIEKFILESKVPFVLNTGELTDSFCMMDRKMLESILNPFILFENTPHKVLFVTKFNPTIIINVTPDLLQNAIFSFSISPFSKFEEGTELWQERIRAAKALMRPVRLRLDPMMPELGWMQGYKEIAQAIFEEPALQVERITLGRLRFFSTAKSTMTDKGKLFKLASYRRPEDKRWVVPDEDFLRMARFIMALFPVDTQFALCKEPAHIWEKLGLDWQNPKCNCVI